MPAEHKLRNHLTILAAPAVARRNGRHLFSTRILAPSVHAATITSARSALMASITLYDLCHFIEEITASRRLVAQGVVRLHIIENEGFWSSSVRRAHVVATTRIGQDLIRLDLFYGPPSSQDFFDRDVVRPMARDLHQLQEACHACGLDIRQGVFEETLVRQ